MRTPTEYLIEQRDKLFAIVARQRQHEKALAAELANVKLDADTAEAEAKAMAALIDMLNKAED